MALTTAQSWSMKLTHQHTSHLIAHINTLIHADGTGGKTGNGNKEMGIITEELQKQKRGKGSFTKATISKVSECVATFLPQWVDED